MPDYVPSIEVGQAWADCDIDLDPGQPLPDAQEPCAGVTTSDDLGTDHGIRGIHLLRVGANHFPTADCLANPIVGAPSGTILPPTKDRLTPRDVASAATILQPTNSSASPKSPPSAASISDPGQAPSVTHSMRAGADLHDALLSILAASVDDIERTRIATQNRIRALREDQGLADSPFEAKLTSLLEGLAALEHQATLDLQRAMRMHPLGAHVKATKGLGEKQAARLLAAIGNPADRPNPAKLWQYAGHGDPMRSRKRKGQVVEFNPTAKMRVHLCAESAMKTRCGACTAAARAKSVADDQSTTAWQPPHDCTCSTTHPLRAVYDRERLKWADRDTSDGHKHNHALRVVGKRILLDLWKEARKEAVA